MKIFIFFFISLYSISAFSLEICIGDGCSDTQCVYNDETGATYCVPMNSDGTVNNTQPVVVCSTVNGVESCVNTYSGSHSGTWDSTTHTCSNYATPQVDASGEIICPDVNTSKNLPVSKVDPNPSKDDQPCDPLNSVGDKGCASQKTAIKTNALISETNSRLGSVANSTSTSSQILDGIYKKLDANGDGSSLDDDKLELSLSPSLGAGGHCPADMAFSILGSSYSISYLPICYFAQEIRGAVIALGIFSALLIVVTGL